MDSVELQLLKEALADRYRFDREIGRGGWGTVYLADDRRHSRTVAIKVIIAGEGSLASRERFRREVVLEANLVHPHIVPIFDSGEVGDAMYFVMPFVDGESLQQRIARDGPLPIPDVLRYARHVAEALAHAHENGVVHRDIKPANILIASGNALLADFGIAKAYEHPSQSGLFKSDVAIPIGTLMYMSPEQAAADPTLDGRSDIYSLGCVMYEMLTGKPPFRAKAPGQLVSQHALASLDDLRAARAEVSLELDAVVRKMLAKDPGQRFASADALVAALEEVAIVEAGSGPHGRFRPRRRTLAVVGIAGAALAAGLMAVRPWEAFAGAEAADTSVLVLFPLEGDSALSVDLTAELRRSMQRWSGVTLVDAFRVRDAIAGGSLTDARARRVTRTLGAGRFVRGTVTRTAAGVELHAVLTGTSRAEGSLAEGLARIDAAGDAPRDDGASLSAIVDRLLVRRDPPGGAAAHALGTSSLPAVQHYISGREAILRWDLEGAEAAFDSAQVIDQGFLEASRWLAVARFWLRRDVGSWRLFALAAARDTTASRNRERAEASALVSFADGDLVAACGAFDGLTRRAPLDFAVWYSAATCHDRDHRIVPDARSPSGWRFQSGYHSTIGQYLRAFQLMPNAHRALRDDSFERVRKLLLLGPNAVRLGTSSDGSEQRYAFATVVDDTLAFIPYPAAVVFRSDSAYAAQQRDAYGRVLQRQRALFRDLSAMWLSADPASVEGHEAHALALQLLGDAAALDTISRAVALASSDEQRFRLAGTEVWLRLRFALPDDGAALRHARRVADSTLQRRDQDSDLNARVSLAALTGRVVRAVTMSGKLPAVSSTRVPAGARRAVRRLEILAALGGAGDSIRLAAQEIDSLLSAIIPSLDVLGPARAEAFSRAARLAWLDAPLPVEMMSASPNDQLLPTLIADVRADTARVREGLRALRALRRAFPPRSVSFDALLVEATLVSRYDGAAAALDWLDEPLRLQRTSPPEFDPVNAAAFVRAMVLRADLAAELMDRETARRWAAVVAEMWSDADESLQPVVRRMRKLARE